MGVRERPRGEISRTWRKKGRLNRVGSKGTENVEMRSSEGG